jgi:hypothetical protein
MNVTEKMIEANRRNAQKSTGPRTPEGRAVVARNAITHGLTAKELVLPGERKGDLVALREGLYADLRPEGELECLLADRVALAMWRLRRVIRFEAGFLENQVYDVMERSGAEDSYGKVVSWGGGASLDKLKTLAGYETNIERGMYKALEQLRDLQAKRLADSGSLIEMNVD